MRLPIVRIGEIVRFLLTGCAATLFNMLIVWLTRGYLPARASIAIGLVAGMCASFLLMKFFAFKASGWQGGWGEAVRFLLVYAAGTSAYLLVAFAVEHILSDTAMDIRWAAIGGVFAGGVIMAIITYAGHRNFTYRVRSAER